MIKKFISIVFFLVTGLATSFASDYLLSEFMPENQIKSKWGSEKFDENKFKSGTRDQKAKMAFDLIKSKKYVGKTNIEVFDSLGSLDGHYFSESIPAYVIGSMDEESLWQVVFLLKNDSRTIKAVKVHKKCCYK